MRKKVLILMFLAMFAFACMWEIWNVFIRDEGKVHEPKSHVVDIDGQSLLNVIKSASAGDMDSVRKLIVYYDQNDPSGAESLFWIKKGAEFGNEYLASIVPYLEGLQELGKGGKVPVLE